MEKKGERRRMKDNERERELEIQCV